MRHIEFIQRSDAMPEASTDGAAGNKQITVVLEMRPATEGYAGIPQETRLLFRGLRLIEKLHVEGMIQASVRTLSRGTPLAPQQWRRPMTEAKKLNRYSRVIISLAERPLRSTFSKTRDRFRRAFALIELTLTTALGIRTVRLTRFESRYFEDFIWRTLFSKTLPAEDFKLVTSVNQRICSIPWRTMHLAGLYTRNVLPTARYPKLDTRGVDIFIAQTPYPAGVRSGTALVVRYHDAIPVFMPHTIPDKSLHQATHFHALMHNVRCGAYFACVSDSTRQDLLKLFPEAAPRAVTIHNMVSHHYFPEELAPTRVPQIVRARLYHYPGMVPRLSLHEAESFYQKHLDPDSLRYLLIVSTIEPRKNHLRLISAWEAIKADTDPDLKLVIVGTLGWDNDAVTHAARPWLERGQLFFLNAVPSSELRLLYRNAALTVCPSLAEGFDFSGVEAMASGGIVASSDIPVHREIYESASEYFDPYSTASLVKTIQQVLYSPDAPALQQALRENGKEIAARYRPERILPQWDAFLSAIAPQMSEDRSAAAPGRIDA